MTGNVQEAKTASGEREEISSTSSSLTSDHAVSSSSSSGSSETKSSCRVPFVPNQKYNGIVSCVTCGNVAYNMAQNQVCAPLLLSLLELGHYPVSFVSLFQHSLMRLLSHTSTFCVDSGLSHTDTSTDVHVLFCIGVFLCVLWH